MRKSCFPRRNRTCVRAIWPKGYQASALVTFRPDSTQTINIKKLWPANIKNITTKKKFYRSKKTLQFSIYEKISFFILNKYSPLNVLKNLLKSMITNWKRLFHQKFLSITLKAFEFLTLFVALVGTIDAGVTSGSFKGPESPCSNRRNIKKKLLTHKIHCNNWNKSIFW